MITVQQTDNHGKNGVLLLAVAPDGKVLGRKYVGTTLPLSEQVRRVLEYSTYWMGQRYGHCAITDDRPTRETRVIDLT